MSPKTSFALSFLVIFSIAAIGIYFRPLLPVDETRYISVAWEMYDKHSFLVPLLNSEPYHHKPPLLFWLIDLFWYVFGVKEWIVRFIPTVFGFLTSIVAYFIAKELWKDDIKSAILAPLILSSMALFSFFSSMLTFDVMLSFWVSLSFYFLLKASDELKFKYFFLTGLSIGGGALTKGPVILVHILPAVLYLPYLKNIDKKKWFFGFLKAFLIGLFIALLWAIPAAIHGGEKYAKAIFWGQSAHRVVSSFAHKRPFWWYLPMLVFLFMPYVLAKPFFKIKVFFKKDESIRLLLVWIGGSVFLFSLISGKQIQYLLPEIVPFALIISRIFAKEGVFQKDISYISFAYLIIGLVFFIAISYLAFIENRYHLSLKPFAIMAIFTIFIGLWLLFVKKYVIESVALSMVLFILSLHIGLIEVWKFQSLKTAAKEIGYFQKKGEKIAVIGKYHDEYHFLGRLKEPIFVIKNEKKEIERFKKDNPNAIIVYRAKKRDIKGMPILRKYSFRNREILFIRAKDLKI